MCNSKLHTFLTRLPKCEHHIHIEGALTPTLFFSLASKNSIPLPPQARDPAFVTSFDSASTLQARYDTGFSSLDDFLPFYYVCMSALLTASDFEELGWSYFRHASQDGVKHAEVFFDPQAHTSRSVKLEEVVEGLTAACKRAEKELGISTLLVPCFLRHLPVQESMDMFEEVKPRLLDDTLAGIGLDSSEKPFPPEMFEEIFKRAEEAGIRRTAHAGEEGPAENIRKALDLLKVQRVDHGRTLAEDVELMKEVADKQLLVTLCPLSNVQLKGVKKVEDLPIRTFLDNKVRFSINSDDPAYFGGFIQENYCRVQEAFDLKVEDWVWIAKGAIEGSWCGDERKEVLLREVENVVKELD